MPLEAPVIRMVRGSSMICRELWQTGWMTVTWRQNRARTNTGRRRGMGCRKLVGVIVAGLSAFATAVAAQTGSVIHHEVEITLDPPSRQLRVTDSIVLRSESAMVTFR